MKVDKGFKVDFPPLPNKRAELRLATRFDGKVAIVVLVTDEAGVTRQLEFSMTDHDAEWFGREMMNLAIDGAEARLRAVHKHEA